MIEQSFNYAYSIVKEMTEFFETGMKNLDPKGEKIFSQRIFASPRQRPKRKSQKKRKQNKSDSSFLYSKKLLHELIARKYFKL